MKLTLKEIAELVGGSIEGDSSISIQGIGALILQIQAKYHML